MKTLALTCDDPAWRRVDFSLLALIASHVAGSDANHPQLRTVRHEEALLAFLDWVLTKNMEERAA
jgi:hypothetical protein